MLLEGKKGLILGVANKRSIAWQVAKEADKAGAELVLTYQNDRMKKGLDGLVGELERAPRTLPLDVTDPAQMEEAMASIKEHEGHLDFVVHAVAFARREDLTGEYVDTDFEGFAEAMKISAHSFVALSKAVRPLTEGRDASLVTMTYLGAERAVPGYNVMGVAKAALEASVRYLAVDLGKDGTRVNAISAGPIKTLAASGVGGFSKILDHVKERAPLKRNVEGAEVGKATLFFLSDLSSGVTGEVLYVDSGFHAVGY